jgi:hypothetical protein
MGNSSGCMGLFLFFFRAPTPRGDGTDDRLTAGMDVDVLDSDLLLPLAAIPLERFDLHREGPQQLGGEIAVAVLLRNRF